MTPPPTPRSSEPSTGQDPYPTPQPPRNPKIGKDWPVKWRYRRLARNGVVGNGSFLVIRESPIPGENSHRTGNSAARSRRAPILAPGSGAVRGLASASSVKHPRWPSKPPRCPPDGIIMANREGWRSGRSPPPRKRAYLNGYREFESPPLRQPPALTL